MKIRIKDNARDLYVAAHSCHHQVTNWEWADTLRKVEGKVLDVETAWLFEDQYNTAPIKGVSSNGLRIMDQSVAEVIDDVRGSMHRCNWCGKPSRKLGTVCPHCLNDGYLKSFYLWRRRSF